MWWHITLQKIAENVNSNNIRMIIALSRNLCTRKSCVIIQQFSKKLWRNVWEIWLTWARALIHFQSMFHFYTPWKIRKPEETSKKKRSNSFSSTLIFKVKKISATLLRKYSIATVSWIILWKFAEKKSLDNSKLIIAITHYLLDTAHKILGSISLTHLFPIHPNILSLPPENIQKPSGFFMFLGGWVRVH